MIRDRKVSFIGHDFDCVDEGFGEDNPVDVVVRPEDIYFVDKEKAQFSAKVKSCVFKGVHYEMFVDTDTGNELMIQDSSPEPRFGSGSSPTISRSCVRSVPRTLSMEK